MVISFFGCKFSLSRFSEKKKISYHLNNKEIENRKKRANLQILSFVTIFFSLFKDFQTKIPRNREKKRFISLFDEKKN